MAPHPLRAVGLAAAAAAALTASLAVSPAAASTFRVDGEAELRAAVSRANQHLGADRIVLRSSVTFDAAGAGSGSDGPEAGDLDVTGRLTVVGNGHTIDANGVDRIFDVAPGAHLGVEDTELRGGAPEAGAGGGAVRSAGTLVLERSVARNNTVVGEGASGGALFNDGGTMVVRRSQLSRNTAARAGGAIEAGDGSSTRVLRSTLSHNGTGSSPGNGGALHLTGEGYVLVHRAQVTHNVASAEGGGLWNSSAGMMRVEDSTVAHNTAAGAEADNGGGGLFNDGGRLVVVDSRVSRNSATGHSGSGGGLLNNMGELRVRRTMIEDNHAQRAGGGVEAVSGTTDLFGTWLLRNRTGANPGNGGGLHLTGAGTVYYEGGAVRDNTASSEGGGLWNSSTGTMRIYDVALRANTAGGDLADNGGGGLFNDGGVMVLRRSAVTGNTATGSSGSGGGVLNNGGALVISRTAMRHNDAVRAGGAIETAEGTVRLRDVFMKANRTGANPGNGGGLHVGGAAEVSYVGGAVTRNHAANEGGGLWNSATGTLTVADVRIADNEAPAGADVYNDPPGGTFTIDGEPVPAG